MDNKSNAKINDGEKLIYSKTALLRTCEHRNIRKFAIMRLFNQSNTATVQRWLDGNDIYVGSLIKISNKFDINLLSFFEYKGHKFRTTLDELARAERAGIDIASLTVNKDVKLPNELLPVDDSDVVNLRTIIATQKELIEAQKEIIANLRKENERLKKESRQQPLRYDMVADDSHIDMPNNLG